jgi:hypothetical protein
LLEGEPSGTKLEVHHVERRTSPKDGLARGRRHAPQLALEIEARAQMTRSRIDDEPRLARVEHRHLRLILLQEDGFLIADDFGEADYAPRGTAAARAIDLHDAPDGVPHLDMCAGGDRKLPTHLVSPRRTAARVAKGG